MADNPKREELLRRRSVASKAEESIGGKPRKLDQAAILKATAERRQREQRQPQQNERRPRGDPAPDLDGGFGFSIVDVVLIFLAMVVAVGGMWGIVYMVNSDSAPDAFKSFGRKTGVPPVQFRLEVPLHVVYSGSEVTVDFPNGKQTICSECRGAGGQGVRTCPTCYGKGITTASRQIMPGFVQRFEQRCQMCKGAREIIKHKCKKCKGKKVYQVQEKLKISVPTGAAEGYQLVLKEQGNQQPGYVNGDVVVELVTKKHKIFSRLPNGRDLEITLRISLREALLGFSRHLKHLDGHVLAVEQRPGDVTGPYTVLRLRGEGLPVFGSSGKGDLVVRFKIKFPAQAFSPDDKQQLQRVLGG